MEKEDLQELIDNGMLQSVPDVQLIKSELEKLTDHGLVNKLSDQFFEFENNLTWEVVYETLLYAERRRLHALVAQHIEKGNEDQLGSVADVLAYHYEKSGNIKKCILYYAIAGERAADMFSNEDALQFYNCSLESLEKLKQHTHVERSLLYERIGDVSESKGDHKQALIDYQASLEYWRNAAGRKKIRHVPWKIKPSTYEAYLARKIAMSLEHLSEYSSALGWLDEAERLLPGRPGKVASQVFSTRSAILFRKEKFNDAIKFGKKALKSAKRSGEKKDQAYAHNMLANAFLHLAELDKAVDHLIIAEKICVEENDYPGIATTSTNLGNCYHNLGRLKDAAKHFKKSLQADEKMCNTSGVTFGNYNLGNILLDLGELPESEHCLRKVINEYDKGECNRREWAFASLVLMGKCCRLQGDLDKADEAIKKALNIELEKDQFYIRLYAKYEKIEILLRRNKVNDALKLGEEVSKDLEGNEAGLMESQGTRILGQIYVQKGEYEAAVELFNKSINLAKELGMEHDEALAIMEYAKVLTLEGKRKMATEYISKAIEMLTKIGAKLDLEEAKNLVEKLH